MTFCCHELCSTADQPFNLKLPLTNVNLIVIRSSFWTVLLPGPLFIFSWQLMYNCTDINRKSVSSRFHWIIPWSDYFFIMTLLRSFEYLSRVQLTVVLTRSLTRSNSSKNNQESAELLPLNFKVYKSSWRKVIKNFKLSLDCQGLC